MNLESIKQNIKPILDEFGIKYAGVFGSVARGEATSQSDVDILVRLGRPMNLISYSRFIEKLESSLHSKVDVITEKSINSFMKPYIMTDLKTIYEN